jgi:hypothetical protein
MPSKEKYQELQNFVYKLYSDQESLISVLQNLNLKWKYGEDITEYLDTTIQRYQGFEVLLYYFMRKDSEDEKNSFLTNLSLIETEEAQFLDDIATRYSDLAAPFREFLLTRRGTINHLTRISVEGIFYAPDDQRVQIGFSVYTFKKKIMQVRDDVDDFIWFIEGIVEQINTALENCQNTNSPLSENYIKILEQRFSELDEDYQKLKDNIEALTGNTSSRESSVSTSNIDFGEDDA